MASQTISFIPIAISAAKFRQLKRCGASISLPSSSILGENLIIRRSNLRSFVPKCQSAPATTPPSSIEPSPAEKPDSSVQSSPDSTPDSSIESSPDSTPDSSIVKDPKLEEVLSLKITTGGAKWSARATRALALGRMEAKKMCYPQSGTEAILMGLMLESTSPVAKYLRSNGFTFFDVQNEAINLLGRGNVFYKGPPEPPFTVQAKNALLWIADEMSKSGEDGEVSTAHLLLGIWAQKNSAARIIMTNLGFNDEKAKEVEKLKNQDMNYAVKQNQVKSIK